MLLPSPQPAGHGRDQGGAFPAAVLRLVERHMTLWRQILQSLLHDPGEAGGRGKAVMSYDGGRLRLFLWSF